jgi:HSP20 family protein
MPAPESGNNPLREPRQYSWLAGFSPAAQKIPAGSGIEKTGCASFSADNGPDIAQVDAGIGSRKFFRRKGKAMAELTIWKNEQLRQLKAEMDAMVRDFIRDFGTPIFEQIQGEIMPVDFSEDGKSLIVSVSLPGLDIDNLEVAVSDDALLIDGQRRESRTNEGRRLVRSQHFSNRIKLPCRVDPEQVAASYENGKLAITLPKCRAVVFKKIPVRRANK